MGKKLILLTTEPENFVTESFEKEAKKKDFEVNIINPTNCYISLCHNNDIYISHDGTKLEEADFCIPRLSEDNLEYKIAIMNNLEKMGIKLLNPGNSMRTCSNKVLTQILLANNDVKTPKTVVLTDIEQLEYAVKAIGDKFPVVIKTMFGTHGIGVIKSDSMSSLKSMVQQLLKSQTEFMIQEYIEHKESMRSYVLGDKVVVVIVRTITGEDFRSNAHQGAELKAREPSDKEKEISLKCAELVKTNFSAIDYILVDDEPIVFEINGSPGFEKAQEILDFNMAETVIDWISENFGDEEDEHDEEEHKEHKDEHDEDEHDDEEEHKDEHDEDKHEEHDDEENKVLRAVSSVIIKFMNDQKPIDARIDTGATHSSLHADDIEVIGDLVKFRFGDYQYKFPLSRHSKIKTPNNVKDEWERRPVITVDLIINGHEVNDVELTLTDRSHMKYQVLIGRSTLIAGKFLVDPSEEEQRGVEEE